ncbi:YbhB/YbcL family Raf kinase inhibitor-like protein [Portibacter marinus]|uniref:YbhB/YbcL family Raf kinase inhibitor-like protein n=1 Tax=Portibacter marinus TaxID=2898660 RepID=UPI001F326DCF|nr:YbhB/YbcL family Raf kinase inhibitor-like protein [Portibacter marinus]
MNNFKISSSDLKSQMTKKHVFNDFGAGGENVSPHLKWENAPEGTKSFIVICYDPDAPTVSGWWHWCVANIPASTTEFKSGISEFPDACVHGLNDYGSTEYGGACPPPGDPAHAYQFTVYALSTERLEIENGTQPAMIMFMANEHILGRATITSYYSR